MPRLEKREQTSASRWHAWQLALQAHADTPDEPRALSAVVARADWEHVVSFITRRAERGVTSSMNRP